MHYKLMSYLPWMPAIKGPDGTIKYFDGPSGKHYKTQEEGIKVFVAQPPPLAEQPPLLPLKPIDPGAILGDVEKAMGHTQACWSDDQKQWWKGWAENVPQDLEAVRFLRGDHYGESVTVSKIPNWEWPLPHLDVDTAPQPPTGLVQRTLPTVEPVTFDNPLPNVAATGAPDAVTPSNAAAALPTVTNGAVALDAATTTSNFGSSFSAADRARATRSAERMVDENQTMELTEGDLIIVTQAPDMNGAGPWQLLFAGPWQFLLA